MLKERLNDDMAPIYDVKSVLLTVVRVVWAGGSSEETEELGEMGVGDDIAIKRQKPSSKLESCWSAFVAVQLLQLNCTGLDFVLWPLKAFDPHR